MGPKPNFNQDRLPFTLAILMVVCLSALALGYYRHTLEQKALPISVPILNQITCSASGGTWNVCGSICRTLPEGTVCPAICVEQCECKADPDCPFGYACGQVVGGVGTCGLSGEPGIDKK